MPIKTYRPTTPTRRFQTSVSREDITKERPEKSLVESKKRTGGRNSTGRVTSRFIGGGAKQAYRVIDFKREKYGVPAVVAAIEYDPNRSARIALLNYADGEKRYILQPDVGEAAAFVIHEEVRFAAQKLGEKHAAQRAAEAVAVIGGQRRVGKTARRGVIVGPGVGRAHVGGKVEAIRGAMIVVGAALGHHLHQIGRASCR